MSEKLKIFQGSIKEYVALHYWVKSKMGKASSCSECDNPGARFEWANISGKYLRDLKDWKSLCSRCHRRYDRGRDYWKDKYCKRGHRLVLTNLYLCTHIEKGYKYLQCKGCKEVNRINWRNKVGQTWSRDAVKLSVLTKGEL